MKILLTTHVFLPEHSAGTEVLTFSTAKELQRLGHTVEVCTGYLTRRPLPESERFDTYEYEGVQVNRFFYNPELAEGRKNVVEAEYNNLFFARWFKGYLARSRPAIVHFFHLAFLSASAVDVCHELNIPMVMTPTDFWLICPNSQLRLPGNALCRGPDRNSVNCVKHAVFNTQRSWIARLFSRLPGWLVVAMMWSANHGLFFFSKFAPKVAALSRRAGFLRRRMNMLERVVVPTRLMEEMLVNNGLDPAKVVFSRYGIRSEPAEARLPGTDGKLRIGFIGGLSEHKGAHLLISAVRSLPENVHWELKIYGKSDVDPRYFEKLKQLAGDDQRIRFCGTFPNQIIGRIFAGLDVLVVPSVWYENTPLVIYSAHAAGCPVIASNLGGMAEVVEHEMNGLLFEVGDIAGIAGALERLAQDRKLLQRLADNTRGPKSISDYVMELQDIYNDILKKRGSNA